MAGAVQAPVDAFITPALADQVMPLVLPPLALEVKVVTELMSLVDAAGLSAVRATVCAVRVRLAVAVVPATLVTVRMKVLEVVMVPLPKAVPLVTVPMLWSTVAVPLLKAGVMVVVPLKGTGLVVATRPVATGAATMVAEKVPGVESVPPPLVATQLRPTLPEAPAVKVMLVVVAPAVMVPPEMVQAKVTPVWAETLAV